MPERPSPSTTPVPRRWRWTGWQPLVAVAVCAVALVVVGVLLELSSLPAPQDSFGFPISVVFLLAAFGPVTAALTLATGIGGSLASRPGNVLRWAFAGAFITCVAGVLAMIAAVALARDDDSLSGDLFAGAIAAAGIVLQLPMASLFRTRWSTRS